MGFSSFNIYDLNTGLRHTDVPVGIWERYWLKDFQYVRSIGDPNTSKKISN